MYVTPELAVNAVQRLQQLHQRCGLSLVAVDEAHCVSECACPPACLVVLLFQWRMPDVRRAAVSACMPCCSQGAAPHIAGCTVPL